MCTNALMMWHWILLKSSLRNVKVTLKNWWFDKAAITFKVVEGWRMKYDVGAQEHRVTPSHLVTWFTDRCCWGWTTLFKLSAKEVCAEGEGGVPPGTAAMCQTGGEEQNGGNGQGGGAGKVVENTGKPYSCQSPTRWRRYWGNKCWKAPDIPDSTSQLMQWQQNAMEMTVLGLFYSFIHASLNHCW